MRLSVCFCWQWKKNWFSCFTCTVWTLCLLQYWFLIYLNSPKTRLIYFCQVDHEHQIMQLWSTFHFFSNRLFLPSVWNYSHPPPLLLTTAAITFSVLPKGTALTKLLVQNQIKFSFSDFLTFPTFSHLSDVSSKVNFCSISFCLFLLLMHLSVATYYYYYYYTVHCCCCHCLH